MKKKQKKNSSLNLPMTCLILTFVFLFGIPSSRGNAEIPDVISITTLELGSSNYVAFGYIGEYMLKTQGKKLRVIPSANDVARMMLLRMGTVQFSGTGLDHHYAMDGITPRYAVRGWGPQDLKIVWMAQHTGQAMVVRGNSKISSIADLKGKKIPWIPGSVVNEQAEAHLAYAGLTWSDVIKVNMGGYMPAVKAVLDGTVDAAVGMVTTSTFYELQASPYGIRWLPENDPEGIKRIRKKVADFIPYRATIGAGISESNPLDCMTYPYPATVCYAHLGEDLAYFMTKVIHEGYDTMAPANEMMKHYWKLDGFLLLYENSDFAILHPGTVKYLKEIKRWKPDYDKLQKDRAEHYKKLRELWKEVEEETIEKKIKDADFPEFWEKKRKAFLSEK